MKYLARKTQIACFWIKMIPNCQSQPSLLQKKMTFPLLHCRPIQHISYGHWTAPALVLSEHMTTLDLMSVYFQTQTKCNIAVNIGKSLGKAFVKHNFEKWFHVRGIYPLNENIFVEDEFLSSCVTDRPWSQVTEPASASLSSKENS